MASLSFDDNKKGTPIAYVRGGDLEGEILYLHQDDFKPIKKPKNDISFSKYEKYLPTYSKKEKNDLRERISESTNSATGMFMPKNSMEKQVFDMIKKDLANNRVIDLPYPSTFTLIPSTDPQKREIFYMAGASGSGKSYMAKTICEGYKKLYPEREVYLISKLNEDDTLDSMKPEPPKRIKIESLLEDYPELDEFENSMVIFDDYDTITGKVGEAVHNLIDDIAIQGRHYNISMCCLSHYLTNYKKTRLLLNEASIFVIYPMATSYHALKYLLKTHIGMSDDEVKELKKLGRWVAIHKNFPQYMISTSKARILNTE